MRAIPSLLVLGCLVAIVACGRAQRGNEERIDLAQNVTSQHKPQDRIFVDFEKNWRQFISTAPDITLPVVTPERKPQEPPWDPRVVAECVFSADAGGMVPQATLTWNEPVDNPSPDVAQLARQQRPMETPRLRFDLSVYHDGFGRGFYTTALATDKQERFKLPSNSAMVNNQEAVMLTGPGLFPKLVDFNVQAVQDRDTGRQLGRRTLILRDLNPGVSYTIRRDRPDANAWNADGEFTFLTPICPH
jgi:hypothetical protein